MIRRSRVAPRSTRGSLACTLPRVECMFLGGVTVVLGRRTRARSSMKPAGGFGGVDAGEGDARDEATALVEVRGA